MKGIVLAGGAGTRLHPVTQVISKQLLSFSDKPMVSYPLSTLMLAGIRDILVISTPKDTPRFEELLGDGKKWGLRLRYAVQPKPEGIAQAFLVGREFIGNERVALVLGDNIFYGHDLTELGELEVSPMGRGMAWLDTATQETLLQAAHFMETIERRQGLKIACPEEIAYRMGYIDARQLKALAKPLEKSGYGESLLRVLSERLF